MRIEIKSNIWHQHDTDGIERYKHCPGCWHFIIDEDEPQKTIAKCNECGEIRLAKFEGII